jgi:dTDP-4-amino-4,6-dideoxy-D-galactose acyltransferase
MLARRTDTTELLQPLAWDSEHFEMPIARMVAPDLDEDALDNALGTARRKGYRLVYWATPPSHRAPEWLLAQYSGILVDRKVTYSANLRLVQQNLHAKCANGFVIFEYPVAPASKPLLELAILAGGQSRFVIDSRVPRDKFEKLYEKWIDLCTLRQRAGTVLVAAAAAAKDSRSDILGIMALSLAGGVGRCELIAVLPSFRGCGIGSSLVRAAHCWWAHRRVKQVLVTTQESNTMSCSLWGRFDYRVHQLENFYHFWPQEKVVASMRSGLASQVA